MTCPFWVPGCYIGEEAYSIAILVKGHMRLRKLSREMQIFATDIDDEALETARSGIYPDSIAVLNNHQHKELEEMNQPLSRKHH